MNQTRRPLLLLAALMVLSPPVFADRDEDDDHDEGHGDRDHHMLPVSPTIGTSKATTVPRSAALKKYTVFDVVAHATPEDAWIIVGQKVYDISGYSSSHSGGDVFILGGDNTNIFAKGHGTDLARLNRFLIGTLAP